MAQNSLARETSPYLLQHAGNPVQWHAWNDEALQKARSQNMPIFLSIGYSSCHWCHVMAHESFENEDVAKIMNENFINIKVDREERPDIDDIYQQSCQLSTGQGGWPLSVFLTPDQRPFYVGTYFPVLDSYGRPGFGSILRQLAQAWAEKPDDIKKSAQKFVASLQMPARTVPSKLERIVLDEAAVNLLQMGDATYGGFGRAPKFPSSANISFLFRYAKISGISKFSEFALKTLVRMAKGGIFDQIGGGFHRYSTDAAWLVPHFEKMLYDNALMSVCYAEAFQITRDPFHLKIMEKTLNYVLGEMTSPEGGFYSAQDADSEGGEGTFYVWTKGEIRDILGADADAFCLYYDVTDGGNWEGRSILCNNVRRSAVEFQCGKSGDELDELLGRCAGKLLEARSKRAPPGLDDKIITSWNALMITALAKGHRVSGDSGFLDAAKRCVEFIESRLHDGAMLRIYKDGQAKIRGYLEDYAYYASALLDVFEADPERRYLQGAQALGSYIVDHFWDPESKSFFMTADDYESLIVRPRSRHDLSMPSGNSVAASLLLRLFHLTQDARFLEVSVQAMESQAQSAAENPFAFGHMLNAIYMYVQKPVEITVLGAGGPIARSLSQRFIPESILVTVNSPAQLDSLSSLAFFAGKSFADAETAFVCRDFSCSTALGTVAQVEALL